MEWNEILQICREEKDTYIKEYTVGYDERDGLKFADGIIKINDIVKISHVYKIELHGKDVLWINDNDIIIGLNDIDKFEIW